MYIQVMLDTWFLRKKNIGYLKKRIPSFYPVLLALHILTKVISIFLGCAVFV